MVLGAQGILSLSSLRLEVFRAEVNGHMVVGYLRLCKYMSL